MDLVRIYYAMPWCRLKHHGFQRSFILLVSTLNSALKPTPDVVSSKQMCDSRHSKCLGEQPLCFFFFFLMLSLFFFLFFCLYPSVVSDLAGKESFKVAKTRALLLSPQSASVTGREEPQGSNVTPTLSRATPVFILHAIFSPSSLCGDVTPFCRVTAWRCTLGSVEHTCCHDTLSSVSHRSPLGVR